MPFDLKTLFINFLPFAPMVEEGGEIPDQPLHALARGEIAPMPLMSGSMQDEGQLFVYELFTVPLTKAAYNATIRGIFGSASSTVLSMYPFDIVPDSTDGRDALNILATDLIFFCPLRNVTNGYQSVLGAQQIPTYEYRFKHVMSFDCWGENYTYCLGVVCHGSELPFVFGVFSYTEAGQLIAYNPTVDEQTLSTNMQYAWMNYITNGNPNEGKPMPSDQEYPLYSSSNSPLIYLDQPGTTMQNNMRQEYCAMWDKLGYFY